jgi:hypothetical protein
MEKTTRLTELALYVCMSVRLLVSRGTVLSGRYSLPSGTVQYLLTLYSSQFYPVRVRCILYKKYILENEVQNPKSKQRLTQHFGARRKRLHHPKIRAFLACILRIQAQIEATRPLRTEDQRQTNANPSTVMAWPASSGSGALPEGISTKVPYFLGIMTSIP